MTAFLPSFLHIQKIGHESTQEEGSNPRELSSDTKPLDVFVLIFHKNYEKKTYCLRQPSLWYFVIAAQAD